MKELLGLIETYGATTILSVIAIYLYHNLNLERKTLLKQLDDRTQDYINSLYNISSRIDHLKTDIEDIKKVVTK